MTGIIAHPHWGPCRLGLGFRMAGHDPATGHPGDSAQVLRDAAAWAEGLEEYDRHVAVAHGVLARWDAEPRPTDWRHQNFAELHLDVTAEEIELIRDLVDGAVVYWETNHYADDDPEQFTEDVWDGKHGRMMAATVRLCGLTMWGEKARKAGTTA